MSVVIGIVFFLVMLGADSKNEKNKKEEKK